MGLLSRLFGNNEEDNTRKVASVEGGQEYILPGDAEKADIASTLIEMDDASPDDVYTVETQVKEGNKWIRTEVIKKRIGSDPESPWF